MLNLKSWSQEHPREPLLLLVSLCAALTGYVYTASPEPHYGHSAQAKYTVAKTLPTAGPLLVEAPVFGRRVKPVALALSDDSGKTRGDCVIHRDPHDTWFEFDNKYYGNAESCADAQMEYSEEGKCFVDGKRFHENDMGCERTFICRKGTWILLKPTFHPNPNDYWM